MPRTRSQRRQQVALEDPKSFFEALLEEEEEKEEEGKDPEETKPEPVDPAAVIVAGIDGPEPLDAVTREEPETVEPPQVEPTIRLAEEQAAAPAERVLEPRTRPRSEELSRPRSPQPDLPPSPPLAEKIARWVSETPSRFKSDKRLEQEEARPATTVRKLTVPPTTVRKLTVPRSPSLLTSTRQRVPHVKAVVLSAFKALALNPKIMRSSGDYGVPRVISAPTTSPRPFAFATAARKMIRVDEKRSRSLAPKPARDHHHNKRSKSAAPRDDDQSKCAVAPSKTAHDYPRENAKPSAPRPASIKADDNTKRPFKARPIPTAPAFVPARSSKQLTTPVAPNMPGLARHAAAKAKFLEDQQQNANLKPQRQPLATKNHLNSDARAAKRREFDDAIAHRRQAREADKRAAQAAVDQAQRAELKRNRRTSIAQGGSCFVARPIKHR
ncbi:hypothetical protein CTAYLR_005051 [Chrysophaeum taylorii]|uniref:TPX2 C-terminal domain-containing protein n=1 Tax=Chrysophaeum taylorii TaxID=2483200 RepID=A0AAD7UAP5_9STRA|nr:hypothetical protein CTAYLR_005051 [Chrysophaeum taylorii]